MIPCLTEKKKETLHLFLWKRNICAIVVFGRHQGEESSVRTEWSQSEWDFHLTLFLSCCIYCLSQFLSLCEHVFKEIKLAVPSGADCRENCTRITKDTPVACLSLLILACFGPSTCCGKYFTIAGAHGEKPAGHVWSRSSCAATAEVQCCPGWRGPLAASTPPAHVRTLSLPGLGAHGAEVSKFFFIFTC